MKTTDLMIGDYVTFKDCQNDDAPTIVKIEGLGYQGRGVVEEALVTIDGDENGFDLVEIDDEFVGIPLTPEILEKNGFRKGCYVGGYYSPDCPFRVFTKKDGKCGFTTLFDDEIHFSCIFVHQLQHALRLYGIEKEIEL